MFNQWLLPKILITYSMTKIVKLATYPIIPTFPIWQYTYM